MLEKIKEYLTKKKNPYVETIAKDLGIEEYQVYGLIELLKRDGYLYDIVNNQVVKIKPVRKKQWI